MKTPQEVSEEEFIVDPIFRAATALSKALHQADIPERHTVNVMRNFFFAMESLTDQEMRMSYRVTSSPEALAYARKRMDADRQRRKGEQ